MSQSFLQDCLTAQLYRSYDGAELAYRDDDLTPVDANAPTALLFHEVHHTSIFWRSWIPTLGPHMRIIRPDLRGVGLSRVPLDVFNPSIDVFLRDANALLDHLQLAKVVWVGSATGALLGVAMAAKFPERISALVVHDPPLRLATDHLNQAMGGGEDVQWYGVPGNQNFIKYGMRVYARFRVRNDPGLKGCSKEFARWYEEQITTMYDPHLTARIIDVAAKADMRPLVKDIKAPTLVLEGTEESVRHPDDRRLLDVLPDVRFVQFPGPGYGLYYLKPRECAGATLTFLREKGLLPEETRPDIGSWASVSHVGAATHP